MILTRGSSYARLDPRYQGGRTVSYYRHKGLGELGQSPPAQVAFTPAQLDALGPDYGWVGVPYPATPSVWFPNAFGGGYMTPASPAGVRYKPPAWYPTWGWNLPMQIFPGGLKVDTRGLDTAHPVPAVAATLPSGQSVWIVPGMWDLNQGQQALVPATARALLGVPLSSAGTQALQNVNGAYIDSRGYLFAYDPRAYIPTGMASGVYKPGENVGRANIRALAMGAGLVGAAFALPVVAGALGVQGASAAALSAAQAGAAAGSAAGSAAAGSIGTTAALTGAASSAPVAASIIGATPAAAAAAASLAVPTTATAVASTAGVLKTAQSVYGAAKSAFSLYKQYTAQAQQLQAQGDQQGAQLAAQRAAYYNSQAGDLLSTKVGGIPLPWLAIAAAAALFIL